MSSPTPPPSIRGRGRGRPPGPGYTGAKRGRKPGGAVVHWAADSEIPQPSTALVMGASGVSSYSSTGAPTLPTGISYTPFASGSSTTSLPLSSNVGSFGQGSSGLLSMNMNFQTDEMEEEEALPDMADEEYDAQLSWQNQVKDDNKVLMGSLTDAQQDRFQAYRRTALPQMALRRLVHQTLGQQASKPVAQIIAGIGKVFVGEIIEEARKVQERRGESGPLAPDHLREAYRAYQEEFGRVGVARPIRNKRLFVR